MKINPKQRYNAFKWCFHVKINVPSGVTVAQNGWRSSKTNKIRQYNDTQRTTTDHSRSQPHPQPIKINRISLHYIRPNLNRFTQGSGTYPAWGNGKLPRKTRNPKNRGKQNGRVTANRNNCGLNNILEPIYWNKTITYWNITFYRISG